MSQTGISSDQIRKLAEAIARELAAPGTGAPAAHAVTQAPAAPRAPSEALGDGVFATIDEAAKAATQAFYALDAIGLTRRYAIIESIRQTMRPQAEPLARVQFLLGALEPRPAIAVAAQAALLDEHRVAMPPAALLAHGTFLSWSH